MALPVAIVNVSTVFGGPGAVSPGLIVGQEGFDTDVDTQTISCVGDQIVSHGPGAHIAATMVQGSLDTFANGLPVCRLGDLASCGCVVIGPCSKDTFCL